MGQGVKEDGEPGPAMYTLMAPKSLPSHVAEKHLIPVRFKTELIISLMSVFLFVFPMSVNETMI